jgi:sirohydrochlorin ferrochelatase
MKAILLVSHGSRSPKTKKEIAVLAEDIRQRLPGVIVEYAFLEIESPGIPEGIVNCISQGAVSVVLALNFLNAGRHVDEDIPAIVHAAQKKYPQVKFFITKPVGKHERFPNLIIDLINNV